MSKDAPLTALDKVAPVNAPEANHGIMGAAAAAYSPSVGEVKTHTLQPDQREAALQKQLDKVFTDIYSAIKNGGNNIDAQLNDDARVLAKLLTTGDKPSSTSPTGDKPISPTGDKPVSPTGDKTVSPTCDKPVIGTGDKPTTQPAPVDNPYPDLPQNLKGNLPLITVKGDGDIQKKLGSLGTLTESNGAWTLDAHDKQINPLYLQGVDHLTIKNAVFAADGMAGTASVGGVRMDRSDHVTVENSLFDAVSFGVLATAGDSNVHVDNNKFVDMQGAQTFKNGIADHQYFSSAVQIVNSKPTKAGEGNSDNSVSGNTVLNQDQVLTIDGKQQTIHSWTNDNFNFGADQFTYAKDGGPGLIVANNTIDGSSEGTPNANLQNSGSGMQFEFNTGVLPGATPGNGKDAATTPVFVVEGNHVNGQITQGITDTSANHGLFKDNVVDMTNPSEMYLWNNATGTVTDLNNRAANTASENAFLDAKLGKGQVLSPYTSWQGYGISNRSNDSKTNQFVDNTVVVPDYMPKFSGPKNRYNPLSGQDEINTKAGKPSGVTVVPESQAHAS